jgi:alpha-beta hydrolase superfamily lysophospholipase
MRRCNAYFSAAWQRGGMAAFLLSLLAVSCQCKPNYTLVTHAYDKPRLGEKSFTTTDGQTFPCRKFIGSGKSARDPETVVIALHGFCGASIDYENLGNYLIKEHPEVALYAYDIRGQGFDPVRERRGDIDAPDNWYRDLHTFTALVRKNHPRAKVVWQGESMGALILSNAYLNDALTEKKPPCDAIVLSSPIVGVRGDFPEWKRTAIHGVGMIFPSARLSLKTLSGGENVRMTATSTHAEQSETNAWHIERHTLRLLTSMDTMIVNMQQCAETFQVPVLVLHGGKDYFTPAGDVVEYYKHLVAVPEKHRCFYPEGHHLLMYDVQKEKVIADIGTWLSDLPERLAQKKSKDTRSANRR